MSSAQNSSNWITDDAQMVWHPYADPLLYANPIPIVKAQGAYLFDEKGNRYIDAVSSWWTTLHGHSHPHIGKRIAEQQAQLDHVIFSGFTHQPAVELAKRLLARLPNNCKKIFYSDNGSTAVEVAIKMALQYFFNLGQPRKRIIAFHGAYHGDTFGAMAVSERNAFTTPFQDLLFEVVFIEPPLKGKTQLALEQIKAAIAEAPTAAFIFEPLLQGTAGMLMHEADGLSELVAYCQSQGVLTIADEVMVGFGRTGKFFASEYLSVQPDLFCLSKGLTGGTMALGITACTAQIANAFNDVSARVFFHGHSYTANPIACASGLASLDVFDTTDVMGQIQAIATAHQQFCSVIGNHKRVKVARTLGTVFALEVDAGNETSYFNQIRQLAYPYFLKQGILMRPLGNVLYILPPYCISTSDLQYIYNAIETFLNQL